MNLQKNISLKKYNTFNVEANARWFVSINHINELHRLIDSGLLKDKKRFVLGAGSNTLFVEDYDGVVIKINLKGMRYVKTTDDHNIVEVAAGEKWHDFVSIMQKNNLYGIENLACIPGEVGAAPIQNIGAFGVEQKDYFHSLQCVSLETNELVTLSYEDCKFGYRDSAFKHELKNKYIITSVQYALKKTPVLNYKYSSIATEIKKFCIENPDTQYIIETIDRLRRCRLPDIKEFGNVGSFFKNPIITKDKTKELLKIYSDLPVFTVNEKMNKIPAAFLIEKAGWKGKRIGNVGIFQAHALIIINYKDATGKEILSFANDIESDIYSKFNIHLQKEVVVP